MDYHYIGALKSQLNRTYRMEEEYWRTRSKSKWLQLGDMNTMYFHAKTKQRRSFKRITSLMDSSGNFCSNQKDIEKIINSYFASLFTSQSKADSLDFLQQIQPKVTEEMNVSLTRPITKEEVYQALQQMNADKSPAQMDLQQASTKIIGLYLKHKWLVSYKLF